MAKGYSKLIHFPCLIFNDVCCETACGYLWYRPKKKIHVDEVQCKRCKATNVFQDAVARKRKG